MTRPAPEFGDNRVYYTEEDENFGKKVLEIWGNEQEEVTLLGQTIVPVCFYMGEPIGYNRFIVESHLSTGEPSVHEVHKSHIRFPKK